MALEHLKQAYKLQRQLLNFEKIKTLNREKFLFAILLTLSHSVFVLAGFLYPP
jgi:hypothetical protein